MTIEEAIKIIDRKKQLFKELDADKVIIEAFEMAIKVLRQETCDDAISRQAVLDTIDSYMSHHMGFLDLKLFVTELPSVTPQQETGYWKSTIDGKPICSECGFVFESEDGYFVSHYCPNCGRRMTATESEES